MNGTTIKVSNFLRNYPVRIHNVSNSREIALMKKKLERISLIHPGKIRCLVIMDLIVVLIEIIFILKDLQSKILEIPRRQSIKQSFCQFIGKSNCIEIWLPELYGVVSEGGTTTSTRVIQLGIKLPSNSCFNRVTNIFSSIEDVLKSQNCTS